VRSAFDPLRRDEVESMQIGPYPHEIERIQNLTGYKLAMRRIIRRHRQKVQICSALILALWLNLGYLQSSYAFIDALSRRLTRWMLTRSQAPEMETLTRLCKTHAYVLNPEKVL
jgi:hypothetical protein